MKPAFFLALLGFLAAGQLFAEEKAIAPQPNVLFILADDLGWGDVGFHGGRVPTPNLDRLVKEGVELDRHYVYPVCTPTRTAFLTGRYASRFGVSTPQNERALPWDTVTLALALKSVGYDTALCGKWHLGSKPEWGPQVFGFGHSYGSLAGGVGPWDHRYKVGPFTYTWHRNGELIKEEGHVTDLITEEAIRWLSARTERPFFLYVAFTAVHIPIREPKQYLDRVPASIQEPSHREYAACIIHLDDAVGKLLEALEATEKASRTVVVFTSDNGGTTARNDDPQYPPDGYVPGRAAGNNLPLKGAKGTVYEGGIRVPTVVRYPGVLKPGKYSSPIHITDWMPTFCGLAGYQPPPSIKWDGQNIWPFLLGTRESPPRTIYTVGPNFRSMALLDGDWKLIVHASTNEAAERVELYHLSVDPNEENNLAEKLPEKVNELKAKLKAASAADRDSEVRD
ncbi:MAG: sulfatase-like hydrolase/transferase [Thermogutta sp.]